MSRARALRCPACRSDKVTVVATDSTKSEVGLWLTLGGVAACMALGWMLPPEANQTPSVELFAASLRILNWAVMLPAVVLVVVFYLINRRAGSKKRVCRECGKRWKVRSRRDSEENTEPSSQPG